MDARLARIINECPLFKQLDSTRLSRLTTMAEMKTYPKGQTIFRQEDPCPGVFLVVAGMVRVYKLAASGKEHVLHLAGPGKTFAEVSAIAGFPLPANAQAVCDSECLLLPARAFQQMLAQDHEFCRQMLAGMAFWVRHLVELLEDIVLRDAAGRLARYLLEMSREGGMVELPSLKKHVASHLDLTSETFSRTLRRFLDSDLIAMSENGRITILDRDSLQAMSDGM